jgi:hypothetical protein
LRRIAARNWMRVAEDRVRWRAVGETYMDWTGVDCDGLMMIMMMMTKEGGKIYQEIPSLAINIVLKKNIFF